MKKPLLQITCALVLLSGTGFAQDAEGCKDSPLFNRMPNTTITECSKNYDQMEIPLAAGKTDTKEGTKTMIGYDFQNNEGGPSFFQIVKNFDNAIAKTGGKRLYYGEGQATFHTKTGGKEVWVVLSDASGVKAGNYFLSILEIEDMKQDISASDMLEALNKNGSIALYINFETGKADIKAESQKTIDEIAALLKQNASLKISIEGHTDNTGNATSNQTLSENRAKSVMNAVAGKGGDKSRMSAKGWGQSKPLADNGSEDGKAKNRRVEIVKM